MNNTYDFLINDEDEVMLLFYAHNSAPKNPAIEVNKNDMTAFLRRNDHDGIRIDKIPEDVLDSLQDADSLLVCELKDAPEKEEKCDVVYVYEADIVL